jgi:glycosyltransferase involved in cell wall biosynthesis
MGGRPKGLLPLLKNTSNQKSRVMHILIFCHYYPPEVNAPASRTYEHACAWAAAGNRVTVITSAPNHPTGVLYKGYKNSFFQIEINDGVEVVRVWTYLAQNAGFARRTLNYLSFMITALIAVPRIDRPDVILATSPQFFCGLAGLGAHWLRGVPWVLEIRDLWPESIVSVGAMKKGFFIRCLEWIEKQVYRKADRVVCVTDSFVSHITSRRGRNDVAVIKNGVNLDIFSRGANAELTKARFGLQGRVVAAYVGTHGMAHGLDVVLDAARLLSSYPGIGFLLVGDGAELAQLKKRARELRLDNLHIAGQLPRNEMPDIWSATDISLILLKKSDTFKSVLPSKMFEAMAMQCPIVLGVEGEARELLSSAEAGIAIVPENAEELAEAVLTLAEDKHMAAYFGANGLAHVKEHFDRKLLADRFLDLLKDVAS